mgnify:FL=1
MKLSSLLKTIAPVSFYGTGPDTGQISLSPDPEIGSVHYRAQDVKPGGLFVAIKGLVSDGHDFIDEALANGASAIVTQKPVVK